MRSLFRSTLFALILILNFLFSGNAYSDNHNIYEILDLIKKDLKTLERAVYSGSIEIEGNSNNETVSNLDNNFDNEFAFVCLKPDTSSGRPFAVSGSGTPPSKEKAHTNYAQNFVDGEFTQTFGYTINIKADFTAGAEPSGDTLLPPPVAWI